MTMRKSLWLLGVAVALAPCLAAPARADQVSQANLLLCTAVQATVCTPEGDCEIGPPWNWNIPQFIEVDLIHKVLRTTKASGENRATPIKNLERADGSIFLQGVEKGRAFSFAIEEDTGFATIAVARQGRGVTVFGACTTLNDGK
jgi:hypothetical protein